MDQPHADAAAAVRRFPCAQCGAKLDFQPGTQVLKCPYCAHENPIASDDGAVEEHDYEAELRDLLEQADVREHTLLRCDACAAQVEPPPNVTSLPCPFCGSNLVASPPRRQIKPHAVLPFAIDRARADELFRTWIRSLWFAPNKLRRYAREEQRLQGVYTPYWTFDCRALSRYTGQRGDDYWVTQTYTTMVNGRPQAQTRQVRRTRWTPVGGQVQNTFDDILVIAGESLPLKYAERLEPWDLDKLAPYRDEYLSGFGAQSYSVELPAGFSTAKEKMKPDIEATIRGDIGGDHQQIDSVQSRYMDISFKHLLLPVWISAYGYRGRVFRFLINARTGEVQGERPYSAAKIAGLVGLILVGLGAAIWFFQRAT
ncbi:MAG: hypothetical protein U1D55_10815 [Phycisphaerae bacterium]